MSAHKSHEAKSSLGHAVNTFEETAIAVLLGLMTLLTFTNVVLRKGFSSSIIWSQEVTLILFAWLVLFGISYCVKVTAHLGVDALINVLPKPARVATGLVAAAACLTYSLLLMKGAWDYWAPFAALYETEGRWFPLGFDENTRDRAFFETDQVPMPDWLRWLEPAINQGESYSKMPRMIPYLILPIGAALLLFRFVQATMELIRGERTSLIVSHEAEDDIRDIQDARGGQE
ncbi:TRAP transporter small permease [Halovulum sp. GXIMD14794]